MPARVLLTVVLALVSVSLADRVAGARDHQSTPRPQTPPASGRPPAVCGEDERLSSPLPLRPEVVVLAGDRRGFAPCGTIHDETHREVREAAVIAEAASSPDPELRRLYALVSGWMGHHAVVGVAGTPLARVDAPPPIVITTVDGRTLTAGPLLALLLADPEARVRRQAAQAVGDVLIAASREFPRPAPPRELIDLARVALIGHLDREQDSAVAAAMLETLARLPHEDDEARDEVERVLLRQAQTDDSVRLLGAATALESLIRRSPKRPLAPATRQRLRELVFAGVTHRPVPTRAGRGSAPAPGDEDNHARVRRLALMALNAVRDDDIALLTRAAADADWQVRRLVAQRLSLDVPEQARLADALAADPDAHVRYDALGPIGRYAARSKDCVPLARALADDSMHVVLRALDLVPADCAGAETFAKELFSRADGLRHPDSATQWHVPARALVALARLRPADAAPLLPVAQKHRVSQVRQAAASAAVVLRHGTVLRDLAGDADPNVRTAAIDGLRTLKHRDLSAVATEALTSADFQLLRAAAAALAGTPQPERERAVQALLDALARVTRLAWDTSRDARVALIDRLRELLPAERAPELRPYLRDYDWRVREAASRAIEQLTGAAPAPERAVQYLPPAPPAIASLQQLPARATIELDHGVLELELYPDQAPITVARFAGLARTRFYHRLTFHRIVPNFVIQGGSPGANEYAGQPRYMRDEIGLARHVRGAVGISTRGRDTGDGQIFIDLVDLPRLDHEYTVFGRVVAGLDVLDGVLEGAVIRSVSVR